MLLVCLDMEGVLIPEIWPEVAKHFELPELVITSLEEPDLEELNRRRIDILKKHGISLAELEDAVAEIEPFPGAAEFMEQLREKFQVVIISDSALPLSEIPLKKLGSPHIFCNSFTLNEEGELTGFHRRIRQKADDVRALQSMGYETIACGDSDFDVSMIEASRAGFLFRSRPEVRARHPEIRHITGYEELLEAICAAGEKLIWKS